jgi:cobalt/nickel transport system ATP-binding protein
VSESILEVREVHYHYPGGIVGLDGATLKLNPPGKIALLGPNGCGKTSLLLHLCGALRPKQGEVWFNGRPIEYSRAGLRELRQQVGTVLQDADEQLFAASVYQDVSFGPLNLGLSESEVRQRVEESLALLKIEDLADRPPHRLSLGQKKRAALAGVVAMRPRVMILDEPTAGLDPGGVIDLLAILDRMHQGGTQIVFATHDVEFAYAWADEVGVLCRGRVLAFGPTDDLFRRRDLLETANLRSPWLVGVGDMLRKADIWPADEPVPRSGNEFLKRMAVWQESSTS